MKNNISNVYIHIPFCSSKCSYCNFSTVTDSSGEIHKSYIDALLKEINLWKKYLDKSIRSIYFWWWSPSLIDPDLIWKIIKLLSANISDKTEILLEANPQDISVEKLEKWKSNWINRLSIWVQTFQEKFSNFLDREIRFSWLINKILLSKKYFVVSIDLIFWIPNQSLIDIEADLFVIWWLDVDHVSYYALDYKDRAKISFIKEKVLPFNQVLEHYDSICEKLGEFWFSAYEIYNFAKKWRKCIHNNDFWLWKDYIWFGLSAVSGIWKNINTNVVSLNKYLSWKYQASKDELNDFEFKHLMFQRRIRSCEWVSLKEMEKLLWADSLENILKSEFIEKSWELIRLNQKWKMFFNDFFEEIF